MKTEIKHPSSKILNLGLVLSAGFALGVLAVVLSGGGSGKTEEQEPSPRYDDTARPEWDPAFRKIRIESATDGKVQEAYYLPSASAAAPLVVSLHTWSGDFTQEDPLAPLCKAAGWNYIHPDFRGPNWTREACCSSLAIGDIDEAIDFALAQGGVDPARIYVAGVSGGGYATLAMFMKSRHRIRKFSAWVPISDLEAWYRESRIRGHKYADDILACTGSTDGVLNQREARDRSPLAWETPPGRLDQAELVINAGVYDGIQGSVPITHSINFYNKILRDLYPGGAENAVTPEEKAELLESRAPLGEQGEIGGRSICLEKSYGNLRLVIFTGNHEMLPEAAMEQLTNCGL